MQGPGLAAGPGSAAVTSTASAPGYTTNTSIITVVPTAFEINQGNFTTTTFSTATPLSASMCAFNAALTSPVACGQSVGPQGGGSVTVTVTSSNTAVGTITNGGTVTFTVNGTTDVGGISFQPSTAGTSTISVVTPSVPAGYSTASASLTQITATVN